MRFADGQPDLSDFSSMAEHLPSIQNGSLRVAQELFESDTEA